MPRCASATLVHDHARCLVRPESLTALKAAGCIPFKKHPKHSADLNAIEVWWDRLIVVAFSFRSTSNNGHRGMRVKTDQGNIGYRLDTVRNAWENLGYRGDLLRNQENLYSTHCWYGIQCFPMPFERYPDGIQCFLGSFCHVVLEPRWALCAVSRRRHG